MTLLDDLATATNRRHGPVCGVGSLLASLPPAESTAIGRAIDARVIYATTLASILERNGHGLKAEAIQRHRRGECECPATS